jgi:hypothetical protein
LGRPIDAKDFDKLLKSLAARGPADRGILTARAYVGAFKPLLAGDPGAVEKFFGFGTTAAWASALKDSGRRLTYRDDRMELLRSYRGEDLKVPDAVTAECRRGRKWDRKAKAGTAADLACCDHLLARPAVDSAKVAGFLAWFERHAKDAERPGWDEGDRGYPSPERVRHALRGGDAARKWLHKARKSQKADDEGGGLADGACMEFDCVLTSKRQDRDGDVLEPAGADLDPRMPLLWQHIPIQPIGKLTKVLDRDDDAVRVRFAVADNALGRDAALLVSFGALRISHGFVPVEFEPLEDVGADDAVGEGQEGQEGWHVTKYRVLEGSVVSIPSNPDAVITAYSRKGLHHPLVKGWAKRFFDARPRMVRSGYRAASAVHLHVHV